jgi:hypothetical protein
MRKVGVELSLRNEAVLRSGGHTVTVSFDGAPISRTMLVAPALENDLVALVVEFGGGHLSWSTFAGALATRGINLTAMERGHRSAGRNACPPARRETHGSTSFELVHAGDYSQ